MPSRNDETHRTSRGASSSRSWRKSDLSALRAEAAQRSGSQARPNSAQARTAQRPSDSQARPNSAQARAAQRPGQQRAGRENARQRRAGRSGSASQREAAPAWQSGPAGVIEQLLSSPTSLAIAVGGIVVALILIFAVIVPSCSSRPAQDASQGSQASAEGSIVAAMNQAAAKARTAVETANQMGSLETSNTKVQALITLLGEEETAKLIAQAKQGPEALWIAAHPDAYAFEGIELQYKVLKLAADEPKAIPFVRKFPSNYPMAEPSDDKELALDTASPSSSVPDTNIPHLYQWDRRWGYTLYGTGALGLSGAAPTSLAMVYQGLSGATDRSPYDIAALAQEKGYVLEGGDTDNALFAGIAGDLGLTCTELASEAEAVRGELSRNHPIIVNVGAGHFATADHFFVLAGLADDGKVIVNDPFSYERSSQTWDLDLILPEANALFCYSM